MGKIVTYKKEAHKGVFCQIKLESGERILIGIAQSGVRISKLGLGGLIPIRTIWESDDFPKMVTLFGDIREPDRHLLDSIIVRLIDCKNLEDVKQKLEM